MATLETTLRSESGLGDSYEAAIKLAFAGPPFSDQSLAAFEENRSFVYAASVAGAGLSRRLLILKPSIFVVDDELPTGSVDPACLSSQGAPEISNGRVRVTEGNSEITWETLPPHRATYVTSRAGEYLVEAHSLGVGRAQRLLHVLRVTEKGHAGSGEDILSSDQDTWELTIPLGNRLFHLWLPLLSAGAGEIAISTRDGGVQAGRQPFPSGILPHGPKGNRLLDSWDADYRGANPPAWDIGRPADELQRLVKEGGVRKCRAVDLGCGSGTDAIFLASQGFEVTGIDISPTALGQAEEKARNAGVSVRWVLADVTSPPRVGPFDFIYDRGCYHNVRDQNLEAYLDTLHRFSHEGTKVLLLSARREAQASAASSGVTEEELRFDFSSGFELESLRQIMLESNESVGKAPGWCALLKRSASP
jgi:SAM-dependent methyltransferase